MIIPVESATKRPLLKGFSLVEIVIALGIFSFCIMGIIYLLGAALDSSRQSQVDSAAAAILINMDAKLRSLPYIKSATALASNVDLSPTGNLTNKYFFFDSDGNPTESPTSTIFRAQLERVPSTNVAALTAVTNTPNISSGITNSTNHYLWVLKISHPSPNFPQTNRFTIGRSLYGSGMSNFYE